jgi:ubiquinone/menaquinone biosynthesis C-methylase UbiE
VTDAQYTHGHQAPVLRSHRWRTAENSAAYLLPALRPGDRLLDVGCGPGTITLDLASRVAPGEVLGIDPSADVIAQASETATGNVRFEVGDVYSLEGTYDVVHAHQVLQHLPDPVGALAAMRRLTRPGGTVAVRDADYEAFTWYPADPRLDRWLSLYREVARRNSGEPDAGRYLVAWAHAAGFTDVRASAGAWCFADPEDRAWWSETWAVRSSDSTLSARAVELGLADQAELDDLAAAWRAWGAHPDAWFAVLHGEILATA